MARLVEAIDVLADAVRGLTKVRLTVYPGAQERGDHRAAHRGIIDHHTGPGSWSGLKRYMATGSSIAPLCNDTISDSRDTGGIVEVCVVACGKANHAGRGYLDWTGTDRGNWHAWGRELHNDGRESWDPFQLEVVAITDAALCDAFGWPTARIADHKTYAPGRKVDRHSVDIEAWRHRVAQHMEDTMPAHPVAVVAEGDVDNGAGHVAAAVLTAILGREVPVLTVAQARGKVGHAVLVGGGAAAHAGSFPSHVVVSGKDRRTTGRELARRLGMPA